MNQRQKHGWLQSVEKHAAVAKHNRSLNAGKLCDRFPSAGNLPQAGCQARENKPQGEGEKICHRTLSEGQYATACQSQEVMEPSPSAGKEAR